MRESVGLGNCRFRLLNGAGGTGQENRPLAGLIEGGVEDERSGSVSEALGQVYGEVASKYVLLRAIVEVHVAELGRSRL